MSYRVRYSAATHVGHVRKINEDAVLTMPELQVWAVSDGMGGHDAGDFASQTVVDSIAMADFGNDPGARMRAIRRSIREAHATITGEADLRGSGVIGATVVTLLFSEQHFVAFWAGDSRLYRLRGGVLEMLTSDHSVVAALVEAGQMTWDEAELHPQSNAITRAVGVDDEIELDKVRGELERGDRFLLCSDGLTKYTTHARLHGLLAGAPIETVANTLVQVALDSGGADNISVIVVDVN